jgi:hypothetical protein
MNEQALALLGMLGMLAALVLGLVGLSASLWLVVSPVERRARAVKQKFCFRLIDLGCLLVYWQVLIAAAVPVARQGDEKIAGALIVLGIALAVGLAMAWWAAVSVLSRAGIEASGRRAAFILISLPGAVAAAVTLVISGMTAVINLFQAIAEPSAGGPVWLSALLFAVSIIAIFLLRLLSLWIAADARAA